MLEAFSVTIDQIYAAAAGSCRWPDALASIEQLTDSAGAVVHILRADGNPGLSTLLGDSARGYFLAEHVEEWTRDYASLCPRLAAASRWPEAPYFVDHMLLGEREMDLNPVYDWYGAYGLRYFIGSRLYHSNRVEVVWSLQRRREQGHAQAADIQLFELLKPHMARAFSLADQLDLLRSHQRFSSAVLEAVPQALFALDGDGGILFANSRAQEILRAADGLNSKEGRLATALGSEQAMLDRLIREAALVDIATGGGWARVPRPSGGPPYAVFVAPLRGEDEELMAANAKVLVVVHDTAQRRGADPNMLVALFGLTNAEARLASALSVGHSLESASALLGIRTATARTELKAVFHKTGVSRQQDLVRLLTSLSSISALNGDRG